MKDPMGKIFDYAMGVLLKWEGGYVNHPLDPGGATNHGITHKTLAQWRGVKKVSKAEVKALTKKEAGDIYYNNYWLKAYCDKVPAKLAICMFDCAVNQGVGVSTRVLQHVLKVKKDGVIGPNTLRALEKRNINEVVYSYMARRGIRYSWLKIFSTFGYGWFRRLFDVYGHAINYKE